MQCDGEAARYRALSRLLSQAEGAHGIEEAVEAGARTALEVLGAASASVSRYDAEAGVVRTLVNVGDLGPDEVGHPTDERYAVTDFPNLLTVAEEQEPWSIHVDDAVVDDAELALVRSLGKSGSCGCPIVLGTRVWGELYLTRADGQPAFDVCDREIVRLVAQTIALTVGRLVGRDELRELVYIDALTGLGNRRLMDETLDRLAEHGGAATVALWDVDGLKQVNDRDGHEAGDRLIRQVALRLSAAACAIPDAVATRLGGDEFCLLVPDAVPDLVAQVVEQQVRRTDGITPGAGVSVGIASAHRITSEREVKQVMRRADHALYAAKRAGGRVVRRSADDLVRAAG